MKPRQWADLALQVFAKREPGYKNKRRDREEKEVCQWFLGTSFEVCAEIWNLIDPLPSKDAKPKHLLWALLLMKNYATDPMNARVVGGVDLGTYRKWSWMFVEEISRLKPDVIVWANRFMNWNGKSICLISIDGVDCPIKEPYPFDKGIFSQKLNGPGYKYEIGVCIQTGDIVWVNGPFKAGKHDVTIFREDGLKDALCDDEGVECDAVYNGENQLKNPKVAQSEDARQQKSKVRGRGEGVNGRLKVFRILDDTFRHQRSKHAWAFMAAAVIVQLGFDIHGPMYKVEYDVEY